MQEDVVELLKRLKRNPRFEVECRLGRIRFGRADVVDDEYVYELKLWDSDVKGAIGQVLCYAKCLKLKPALIFNQVHLPSPLDELNEFGIKLFVFEGKILQEYKGKTSFLLQEDSSKLCLSQVTNTKQKLTGRTSKKQTFVFNHPTRLRNV
jgi:hypothetical protein